MNARRFRSKSATVLILVGAEMESVPRMAKERWLAQRASVFARGLRWPQLARSRSGARARKPASAQLVLKPYGPQIKISKPFQYLLILAALGFCFVYGGAFALFAPYVVMPFAVPPLVLGGLVLWALPELNVAPKKTLEVLLFIYFTVFALWPNYLAVALPGLPWITLQRLIGVVLIGILLISLSMSAAFRRQLSAILGAAPLLSRFIGLFLLVQAVSIGFAADRAGSFNIYLNVLTGWITPFLAGAFVMAQRGRFERFGALLCVTAVALSALAFWENHLGRSPWAGHIPSFLQVNDPSVQMALRGLSRADLERRVQATFNTSLAFSEYLAMAMPFLLNFAFGRYPLVTRLAAAVAFPVVLSALVLTQARTGMIGAIVAVTTYPVIKAFLYWRRNRQNLAASSALVLSPVAVAAFLAISYVVPALHNRMYGGGRDASSNDSRRIQMDMGMPKVIAHPWGYGIGQGADTLQYPYPGAGTYSIDVYPLRLLLEYGVLGAALYYALVGSAIYYAFKYTVRSGDLIRENALFIPLLVTAIGFSLMQIYFALDDNQPVMYVFYGALLALIYRRSGVAGEQSGKPVASARG